MELYIATDGAGWTFNRNWGSKESLNLWHGVEADESKEVVAVTLTGNGLVGAYDEAFCLL